MSDELHAGSAGGLLVFLDYSGEKGLLNTKTAAARKSACVKVLEIDGPNWRDRKVADIDADDQVARFSRKAGSKLSPASLRTYEQRFRDAFTDYTGFLANPTGYRGSQPRRSRRIPAPRSPGDREPRREGRSTSGARDAELITYPFPLAGGTLGYVQLPRDVTPDDAERLCQFIRSVAIGRVEVSGQ